MLLAASLYLWRRGEVLQPGSLARLPGGSTASNYDAVERDLRDAGATFFPLSLFAFAIGLGCFGIAAAGWRYTLWAAPPQEPISGNFSDHPMIEATFISLIYVAVGVGAVLLPLVLPRPVAWLAGIIAVAWTAAGLALLVFGALNYFTHIGLILHTTAPPG